MHLTYSLLPGKPQFPTCSLTSVSLSQGLWKDDPSLSKGESFRRTLGSLKEQCNNDYEMAHLKGTFQTERRVVVKGWGQRGLGGSYFMDTEF